MIDLFQDYQNLPHHLGTTTKTRINIVKSTSVIKKVM